MLAIGSLLLAFALLSPAQDVLMQSDRSGVRIINTGRPLTPNTPPTQIDGGPVEGQMLNIHFFPGVKDFNNGMYAYALSQFNYVLGSPHYLDENPRQAEYISTAYYLRGMIYLYHAEGLGRHRFAKDDFEAATKVNPNNHSAYLELSRVYSALDLKEPAITILRSLEKNDLEKSLADEVQADLKKLTGTPAPGPEPAPSTAKSPVPNSAVGDTSRPGRIAISARVWADVYLAGKQVGTTPLTLELPEGEHTLEFRRDDVRKSVTYNLKANETIAATVPLDVTVDINAVPWAEVTIEGSLVSLGQTPLGGVSVPVGAVLVFRNPAFPEKRHKITESDRIITIAFP